MVRVFIKGGTWKNSEDEILKAAVMKYGKQQWARVASLLNRKSAKQCKARWNEWLDPSVRKSEWSREEDEKLLHLAKLMPAQWRTIGPLVGRTGGQCQERYERLLDEAAGGGDEEGEAGGARKLRPGEIDPHPETKPARPDPIDMDEDEIEMLQEARARLANTQGKKAKRKTREKMLNEAKRLADLQKRRELKAAGLLDGQAATRARGRKGREIDLGVEIPFHKPAPAGFHSTREEDETAEQIRNQRLKDVDYKRIREMQYRSRDREAKEKQKREEARIRSLERSNMQYVVAEVSKRNDPMQLGKKKRGELSMPEPMVNEEELRRVGKATEEEREAMAALEARGTAGATDALLGDYSDRPLPTPMRTPAASVKGPTKTELIHREALNLRALSTGQTPLLGEENAELLEGGAGTGASLNAAAYGATPMIGGKAEADDATANFRKSNPTPLTSTSRRDELGLNSEVQRPLSELRSVGGHDDSASVGASSFGASTFASKMSLREMAREERRRAKRARQDLEEALKNLPAPQFDYELAAPEDVTTEEDDDTHDGTAKKKFRVKDAAEEDREEMERLRKEAESLYEEQSSVMKRPDLPRPRVAVSLESLNASVSSEEKALESAIKLVNEEMMALIGYDTHSHPVPVDKSDPIISSLASEGKGKKDKKRKYQSLDAAPLDYFSEEALSGAKLLLDAELKTLVQEKRDMLTSTTGVYYEADADVLSAAAQNVTAASKQGSSNLGFVMDGNTKGWADSSTDTSAQNLQAEHAAIRNALEPLAKACAKKQHKLETQTGGYNQRSKALIDSSYQTFAELQHSKIEESVYSNLRSHETRGASLRIGRLQEEVERLEEEEAMKQKRYGELMHLKQRLMLKKNSGQGEK
ncbi:hypothetical protein ACHAWO_011342 [Cyclotella atomus]|uniref:Cell division cycle 5-like protein n=1 Tax=Cyclotella atomus TaxID=382360 RepID=A0ABD3QEE4_9STRA